MFRIRSRPAALGSGCMQLPRAPSRAASLAQQQPMLPSQPPLPPPPPQTPGAMSQPNPMSSTFLKFRRAASTNPKEYYPVASPEADDIAHDHSSAYPFVADQAYIARYRDPSRHSKSPPQSYDNKHSSFEARRARLEMERLWEGGEEELSVAVLRKKRAQKVRVGGEPHAVVEATAKQADTGKLALCFPGSGSQYVGMGSFLNAFPSFARTWEEAEEALAGFETWRQSLDLEEMYMKELRMKAEEAAIMGGPMRRGAVRLGGEGEGLKDVVFKGPQDELTRSSNAQPAILITSIAFVRALEEEYNTPISSMASFFAGHSSGEYSALVAARSLSFADAIRLTRLHGLLTTRTVEFSSLEPYTNINAPPERRAQMSALVLNPGRTHQEVKQIVDEVGRRVDEGRLVEVSSYNSNSQVVLSGSRRGVLEACERLNELGIANRAADLPVHAPFHCSFMKPAECGMRRALASLQVSQPIRPVISSLSATPITDPQTLREHLAGQIPVPVRWSECIDEMRKSGVSKAIFVGPGKALANLCRREGETEGWVRREASLSGGGKGQNGGVKLRTRAGVKSVGTSAQASVEQAGAGAQKEREELEDGMVTVRSVATDADFGRVRDLLWDSRQAT